MRTRGFTLIEVLVTLSIVAVLTAILFPVIANARLEGKINRSASNMHQFALALSLYRNDQGDGGRWRGFPLSASELVKEGLVTWSMFDTGGSPIGDLPPIYCFRIPNYSAQGTADGDWWKEYDQFGDQSVFLVDGTFRNGGKPLSDIYSRRFAMGGHLDGHVERKWGIGDFTQAAWWH